MGQVFDFLAESVCESGESANVGAHGEIVSLDVASRNVVAVRISRDALFLDNPSI